MKQKPSVKKLLKAIEAINDLKYYDANKKTCNDNLDTAVAEYKFEHNLSTAYGFMDCINHYNNTYAI